MSLKIEHAHLVLPYQVLQDAWLISREGKITAYGCGVSPQQTFSTVLDAKGQYLTPGFVDLHVHGGAGADFRDGEEAAFVRAMQAHLAGGTTTMLATVSSTTLEGTLESLRIYEAMRQREAQLPPLPRLAGVHLEGPYFSQKERGAQDETIIRLPDAAEYERILEQAPCLRRWSIACELPGALELGERLHKRGIMASVGHSDATTAQVYEAFERGFHSVTHLYSGCSVLHRNGPHREGGVVEAAFLIDEMDVEVIADGVHLPPDFLRLIYKIKGPEHIALITDSIRAGAADVPEGTVVYDDICSSAWILPGEGTQMWERFKRILRAAVHRCTGWMCSTVSHWRCATGATGQAWRKAANISLRTVAVPATASLRVHFDTCERYKKARPEASLPRALRSYRKVYFFHTIIFFVAL